MINKLKNMGLRNQLVMLFVFCIAIILITQLFYNITMFKRQNTESTERCYSTIQQTNTMIDQALDRVTSIGNSIVLNEFTQELLDLNNTKSSDIKRRSDLIDILHNYNKNIINANNILIDIVVVDDKNTILSITNQFSYASYKKLLAEYDIKNLTKSMYITNLSLEPKIYSNKSFAYIIPIYYTSGGFNEVNKKLGTCILWVKNSLMFEVVDSTAATEGATVLVTDGNGYIIALNSDYTSDEINEEIGTMISDHKESGQSDVQTMNFMGRESFVLINKQATTGWNSINIVPTSEVFQESAKTFYWGIGVSIFSIIVVFVFGFIMTNSITRPLEGITEALDKIGNENRKHRIVVTEKNEFGIIAERINTMLDNIYNLDRRIFDMTSQLYEKELLQKEAEMLTLQSQINPHFLYNTLECIRSIAVVYKIKEIQIITTSMAKIFRYSIKGGKVTTIKKELESLEDYYKIVSIRYNERLVMHLDTDEAMYPYSMLKMSLQPVIENTVNYCLEATEKKITVNVRGYIEGEYGILKITDDGVGMEEDKVQEINETFMKSPKDSFYDLDKAKSSIGLSNINLRIKLHYGEDCGLTIESTKGVGTTVTIKIRLQMEL